LKPHVPGGLAEFLERDAVVAPFADGMVDVAFELRAGGGFGGRQAMRSSGGGDGSRGDFAEQNDGKVSFHVRFYHGWTLMNMDFFENETANLRSWSLIQTSARLRHLNRKDQRRLAVKNQPFNFA
jgi:hypothetical protein